MGRRRGGQRTILVEDDVSDGGTQATSPATGPAKRAAPERIGARLAAARAAAKLDLVDIARETRVPVRHLRAIEADAHDELPALPYAVGFVRSLARAVGMDPEDAAARFRAETTMTPHAPMAASIEPLDERRLPSRGLVLASVVGLLVILGGLTAYGAGWLDAPVPANTEVAAPAVTEPAPVPAATAPVQAAAAAGAVPAAAPAGAGAVSIVASDDAWFRVYRTSPETGKAETVKTGLLAKGERYDLPGGMTGLKLWTGRAGALKVSVDGRALPPLGGPVETVRNVSLDADALRARLAPAAATAPTTTAATTPASPQVP